MGFNCAILDTETTGLYDDAEIVGRIKRIIDEMVGVLLIPSSNPSNRFLAVRQTAIHGINVMKWWPMAPDMAAIHETGGPGLSPANRCGDL